MGSFNTIKGINEYFPSKKAEREKFMLSKLQSSVNLAKKELEWMRRQT